MYADYSDCTCGYGKIGRSVVSDVRSTAGGVRHLALPNSVFAPKDDAAVRAPWPAAASEADLAAREEALANTAHIERSVATKLGYVAQNLQSISFVRPSARVGAEEKFDSAFTYTVNVTPEHTISLGRSATAITRPTTVTVANPTAPESASDGQDDALPACSEAPCDYGSEKQSHSCKRILLLASLLQSLGGLVLSEWAASSPRGLIRA